MTRYAVHLTIGYLGRHAPSQSAQGREAAFIDIAQDLLLRELADRDLLDLLTFKGGTAIRKVYAGASGRFSTDLDFAVRSLNDERDTVLNLVAEACSGLEVGGIQFGIEHRRGRMHLTYSSELMGRSGTANLSSKLDVGPPPWLEPARRPWVPLRIHDQYGGPLPDLPVVRLEENIAEKAARLNRLTTARDVYDLVWIARQPGLTMDRDLVRRLAVLKCWVDLHGLASEHHRWAQVPGARPFDIARWLEPRPAGTFDDEQIGLLTAPPPDLDVLGAELSQYYDWLADLNSDERQVARGNARDRSQVLTMLADLPEGRLVTGLR